jgi:hypothetical protein
LPCLPLYSPSAGQLWRGIGEYPADIFLSTVQSHSIKLLVLETILARGRLACLDGKLCANMQSAIQTLAVEDPLKSLPWTQLHKLRKNSIFALSQILNKKEVKRIYEHFLSKKKNIYSEKVR